MDLSRRHATTIEVDPKPIVASEQAGNTLADGSQVEKKRQIFDRTRVDYAAAYSL